MRGFPPGPDFSDRFSLGLQPASQTSVPAPIGSFVVSLSQAVSPHSPSSQMAQTKRILK